ncbi:MAG: glycosyltransferase family 4 protein [Parachlamydiaceae bacterium]
MAKVILCCSDVIGQKMAGPAIRYWELALTLSKKHQVIVLARDVDPSFKAPFKVLKNTFSNLFKELKGAVAIIAQDVHPITALLAKLKKVRLIVDAYDPVVLENLEIFKEKSLFQRNYHYQAISLTQLFSFRMADFVICANERQRDLWIGLMMGLKLLTPKTYSCDSTLRSYIDVVPFGISSKQPTFTGPTLRERYGLKKEDKILLWGGGIWNWFDPVTLIVALKKVLNIRRDVYLVFMGVKHPNPAVPEMKMAHQALELAKRENLLDKHVFFNFDWIPYEDRQNFLLDADIGVSTHLLHLETAFSFRTRILDYIWARLPIISSEGDFFAGLIQTKRLGAVVPCQDSEVLASTIIDLLQDQQELERIQVRLEALQDDLRWEKIIRPIETAIERFVQEKKPCLSFRELKDILQTLLKMRGPEKVIKKTLSLIRS